MKRKQSQDRKKGLNIKSALKNEVKKEKCLYGQ